MKVTINISTRQAKILKRIYDDQDLDVLIRLWFEEWILERVRKIYIPKKSLNEMIDELDNSN